ncbi:MAG: phosphate ABC transporter permease subunit PstC [Coriobacteriia bacterium]|nr:phosphate ABC transporter permease subunit PstC [Coriobacteriia bacterium]
MATNTDGGALVLEPGIPSKINLTESVSRTASDTYMPYVLGAAAIFSGLVVTLLIFFVLQKAWPVFHSEGFRFITSKGWDQQLEDSWSGKAFFGVLELIAGSIFSTLGALVLSLVLGLGCAVFLSELAPSWLKSPFETVIQLLAGIPSVVFGLVGLMVVVPFIANNLVPANSGDVVTEIPVNGSCLLAAIVVLGFMILPFFVTVATDSLRAIPRSYIDGGLALGMTRWRTITRIQLPAAAPGLVAGLVLAAARGIGEAIAISMIGGAIAFVPTLAHGPLYMLLEPIRTMASAIVENGGEAMDVPAMAAALFGLASLLLLFSISLSLVARWSFTQFNRRMGISSDRAI